MLLLTAISVRGLRKSFGEVEAVRGVDFDVEAGEVFGFLGPNGAGKSTTINMLCTLARPSAGSATVAGHDIVRERDAVRRNIGLVFQDPTLDGYLTAGQNLRLHTELYGVEGRLVEPRMRQVMEMVGLWERRAHDGGAMTTGTAAPAPVVAVRVPERSWRGELRAVKIVWRGELIRFRADRMRMATSLVQPLLFLFVLGSGLQRLSAASTHGVDLKTFIYPGILCIAVMFTAMFSAASIVWDREFGFLREMMVAPVRRSSIVIGKCLGGATVASFQGVILICLAWAVDVPYSLSLVLGIFMLQLLLAFTITAFGVMVAARITQMQSFMGLMQMVIMPMFFISGAMFPVTNLPAWLAFLNRIDPLTYAVDPMRKLVFNHLDVSPQAEAALVPGVTWWGWHVPLLLEAAIVALLGLGMLGIAIWEFNVSE